MGSKELNNFIPHQPVLKLETVEKFKLASTDLGMTADQLVFNGL
jgi:hypothetical protein